MAGITLTQAQEKLDLYLELDTSLGRNSELTIDGTTFKRRDIQTQIEYWNKLVIRLTPRNSVRQVIPL
jgi:hypothetical protein